ncbi:MAG: prepilin-type N-terminal cleavage/methylation domain-containing protein [Myxococcota bacterium]|nr:prepilin-type N-terminal cleavage/methylation domain-containing protein [Myxococcota bacterium]
MQKNKPLGFTLVELMIVVVIVAIVCAVTVPGIVSVRYRNTLTEMTNNIQEAGVIVRSLAMRTRHAAVLEVRTDRVWVNLLAGAGCSANIETRCLTKYSGTDDIGEMSLTQGLAQSAGLAMCGGGARVAQAGGSGETCEARDLGREAFAFCYSGSGELFIREGGDANMVCDGGSLEPASTTWIRSCGRQTTQSIGFNDGSAFDLHDGAMIILNRYETACDSTKAEDVRRAIFFPTGGAPFARVTL